MKILHTSDWHIGHALYGKKRLEEHDKFLKWLIELIDERKIDALLVSGDIFDNGSPGGNAEQIYYNFLTSIMKTCCSTVVIVSGNHDSPRRLQAPSGLLKHLDIHVVGLPKNPKDHVIELKDAEGVTGALCCAVPYLRKNEMVRLMDGENRSSEDIIAEATKHFYAETAAAAVEINAGVPIIATGHLFAQGAITQEGDGTRELYVGSLGHVGVDIFPDEFDYVALGHIHGEQTVGGKEHIRYSGSPMCMSFSEIKRPKYVLEIDTNGMGIEKLEVPVFQKLAAVSGDYDDIINQLKEIESGVWAEVTYTSKEHRSSLSHDINEAVKGTGVEVLSIKNRALAGSIIKATDKIQTLETMKVQDVFLRCLDDNEVQGSRREDLISCFNDAVREVEECDLCE